MKKLLITIACILLAASTSFAAPIGGEGIQGGGISSYTDVTAKWASGSCSGLLNSDGTCKALGTDVQAELSLLKGTYTNGGYCKYTASGTLIDCNSILGTDFPGISGTITDEQLLCGENTDGTNKVKSCGAKTTGFDTMTTGEATFKTDTSTIGNMTKSATDGTFRGLTMSMTAGETLAFGAPVYMKSDGKVWKADADAAATMPAIGIIVVGGNADATVTVLTHGVVTETDWNWTVGATIYVADGDAGALTATVGDISDTNDVVQVIGIAIHADTIFVNPSLTTVVLE